MSRTSSATPRGKFATAAIRKLPAAFLALAIVLATGDASAVDLEIAGKVGAATNPTGGSINPLGFGLGARAGVALSGGLYGGISFLYYFGGSESAGVAGLGGGSVSEHTLKYGVEAGYGFTFLDKMLTLRPQVGVGAMTVSGNATVGALGVSGSANSTDNNVYIEPGVTALVSLGTWFVGADANLLVLPSWSDPSSNQSSAQVAVTIDAQVGVKF